MAVLKVYQKTVNIKVKGVKVRKNIKVMAENDTHASYLFEVARITQSK